MHISNKDTVLDIIKKSIDIFNDILYKDNLPIKLNVDYRNYRIKPGKKNGKPNNDLPSNIILIRIK
jgi:hypothetical protein